MACGLRRDPFTAPGWSSRPSAAGGPTGCPLHRRRLWTRAARSAPGTRRSSPPGEVWRLPGLGGDWAVRVVPNRYPVVTPTDRSAHHHSDELYTSAEALGQSRGAHRRPPRHHHRRHHPGLGTSFTITRTGQSYATRSRRHLDGNGVPARNYMRLPEITRKHSCVSAHVGPLGVQHPCVVDE